MKHINPENAVSVAQNGAMKIKTNQSKQNALKSSIAPKKRGAKDFILFDSIQSRFGFLSRKVKHLDIISAVSLRLSVAFLVFLSAIFVFSSLGFLAKIPINAASFYIALVLALGILIYKNQNKIISLVAFGAVVCASFALGYYFFDSSWDGRAYHQIGIYFLANGWNPIYEKMSEVSALADFLSHEIWVTHYLKFSEITASVFYKAFSNIEMGKAINYLLSASVFFYAVFVLSHIAFFRESKGRFYLLILFAFLITANPVLCVQVSSYYVDGLLGNALTLIFLSIIHLESARLESAEYNAEFAKTSPLARLILILSLVISASIKLTGLAYAGFIGVAYLGYKLLFFPPKQSLKIIGSGLVACALIIACNVNPFITNMIEGKNAGYPLLGKDKIDIISGQQPRNFNGMKPLEKLSHSLFSKSQNFANNGESTLKLPFIKTKGEGLGDTDTRIAGFGVYFSGIILLCLLLVLYHPLSYQNRAFIALFLLILGSVLINKEAWWARYVPQMWLLPLLTLIYSYTFKKDFSLLRFFIIVLLLLNCHISLNGERRYKNETNAFIASLERDSQYVLYDKHKWELSYLIKLKNAGISIKPIDKEGYEQLANQGVEFVEIPRTLTPSLIAKVPKDFDENLQ